MSYAAVSQKGGSRSRTARLCEPLLRSLVLQPPRSLPLTSLLSLHDSSFFSRITEAETAWFFYGYGYGFPYFILLLMVPIISPRKGGLATQTAFLSGFTYLFHTLVKSGTANIAADTHCVELGARKLSADRMDTTTPRDCVAVKWMIDSSFSHTGKGHTICCMEQRLWQGFLNG